MRFTSLLASSLLVFSSVLVIAFSALAQSPAPGFRYGLDVGAASLLGDLNSQGMRFAAGFTAAYQFDEELALDLHYFGSSFDDVDHRDLDIGASYYLPGEGHETHLSGGFSFLNNDFKLLSRSGNTVGAYVGGGMSWAVAETVRAGFDLRYHKAATAKATIGASTSEITTVGDSASFLVVFTHRPDLSD